MRPNFKAIWCVVVVGFAGCAADTRADDPGGAATTSGNAAPDASAAEGTASLGDTGDSTAGAGQDESTTEPQQIFDVGAADDGPEPPQQGCSKLDFLFVVDNSLSMVTHQQTLISSFGPFIDTILDEVQAHDFQILVTDSDAGEDVLACVGCLFCGDYCDQAVGFDSCETTLGAGEVQPYSLGASNRVCGVPDGHRYLTSDLPIQASKDMFACMAQVGTGGSGAELPMSALVQAVTSQSADGGCNAGFVRSDAVLVVTVITDDPYDEQTPDDASTVGSPQQWYDAIVAAKGGDADNVVMLGIVRVQDAPTPRFLEFLALFGDRGLTGDIFAAEYGSFFDTAVGLIDTACNEFMPEG
ncbi:MAG: hypothetical protein JKY37_33960 [Nannocystaceae bacterium]|nr:hypothetical protein [Nannocystaceae bacterium]